MLKVEHAIALWAIGLGMGMCVGISCGLLLAQLFEQWSKKAADWIVGRWFRWKYGEDWSK